MSVQDVYDKTVKPLSTGDRLKLAAMILNDIPPQAVADYQDAWSDEDLQDFTAATWKQAPIRNDGEEVDQGR